MMRLIDGVAELVCSVASVRWPVSAMRSADSIVSRSRISPMSTTSGSSRRTARSAFGKECVSACSSRWLTMHFLWPWRNSIGSSIVTMWSCCSRLILSSIAASVVVLPEPVGPGDEDQAARLVAERLDDRRQPELLEAEDLVGDLPEDAGDRAALVEDVGAEAGEALDAEGEVELEVLLEPVLLVVGQDRVRELLGLRHRQRRIGKRDQLPVQPDHRGASWSSDGGRTPHLDHLFQKAVKRRSSARRIEESLPPGMYVSGLGFRRQKADR